MRDQDGIDVDRLDDEVTEIKKYIIKYPHIKVRQLNYKQTNSRKKSPFLKPTFIYNL